MDRKLQLISGMSDAMSVIDKALGLRQNAQLTQGVVDRGLCDNMIRQSAIFLKEAVAELAELEKK